MLQDAIIQAINGVANNGTEYSRFDEEIVRQLVQSIRIASKTLIIIKFKSGIETGQRIAVEIQ